MHIVKLLIRECPGMLKVRFFLKLICQKVLCHQKYFTLIVSLERQRRWVVVAELRTSFLVAQGACPSSREMVWHEQRMLPLGTAGFSLHRARPAWRQTLKELPGLSGPW